VVVGGPTVGEIETAAGLIAVELEGDARLASAAAGAQVATTNTAAIINNARLATPVPPRANNLPSPHAPLKNTVTPPIQKVGRTPQSR
jgi:hypothetical protein